VDSYPSLSERRNGYLRALKENGLNNLYLADFNVNRSQGEVETAQLLAEHPQVTALFCVNDNVAHGALRAAQQLQRRVPRDLSIVGYDDTYLATSISPPLTTMRVDTLAMGRAAVHLLALRVEEPDAARATFITHPELIERASTAAAPGTAA
jgi:LacI family transcriptional regulator